MALLRKREEWADFRRANLNAWGMRLAEAEGTLMKDEYDWTGRLSSWEADLKEREAKLDVESAKLSKLDAELEEQRESIKAEKDEQVIMRMKLTQREMELSQKKKPFNVVKPIDVSSFYTK